MLPYLVAVLLATIALVFGHFVPVLLVSLVLLLLRYRGEREAKRQRAIEALLQAVGSTPEGVAARPDASRFMADDLWPASKQWDLVRSMPDLIDVRPRRSTTGGATSGVILRLTNEGRRAYRAAASLKQTGTQRALST